MNLILPNNDKLSDITIGKKFKCEPLWFVPIKELLGMEDFLWEVVHYVSEYFSDGAVSIACLSRNSSFSTSLKFRCA